MLKQTILPDSVWAIAVTVISSMNCSLIKRLILNFTMGTIDRNYLEFSIYDEMVNGALRPYLAEYSSEENISELYKQVIGFKDIEFKKETFLDEISDFVEEHCGARDGDYFDIEFSETENHKEIRISPVRLAVLRDFFDPCNEDVIDLYNEYDSITKYKVEAFSEIISCEYEKIARRAQKALESLSNKGNIIFFANRNIQIAKRIARQSWLSSRQLLGDGPRRLNNPDFKIFAKLNNYLIRSILLYQELFEPFLKSKIYSEDDLRILLFKIKPIGEIVGGLNVMRHGLSKKQELCEKTFTPSRKVALTRAGGNSLIFKGDHWHVSFNGKEAVLTALTRYRYIAYLLDNPNTEFYCEQLVNLFTADVTESSTRSLRSVDPIELGDDDRRDQRINKMDRNEKDLYRDEVRRIVNLAYPLWEKKNDPNLTKAERSKADREYQRLRDILSRDHKLYLYENEKGKLKHIWRRRRKPELENARTNLRHHIRLSIAELKQKKMPLLAQYIDDYVKTGEKCVFKPPDGENRWDIRFDF